MGPAPPLRNRHRNLREDHSVVHALVRHIVVEIPRAYAYRRQTFAALHAFLILPGFDVLLRKQVFGPAVERLLDRNIVGGGSLRFAERGIRHVESAPIDADMLGQQHFRHLQSVFDLQAVRRDLLLPQLHAQQVVVGHQPGLHREFDLTAYLGQLPLHGIEGRKVVTERHDLPETGIGPLAHLGFGLLQLQPSDLLAQPGELVAGDDLQSGEQGLNGRDGADDAALDHRNRQRPHLRNGEIGLHQSVLRLKEAARCGNLRKVIGERFAVRLRRGVKVQPAVAERAVVFDGGSAALFER